jgi:RimJ/RimL family protein N-acetyltransferase
VAVVSQAQRGDLNDLVKLDEAVIGNTSRRPYIERSILEERCLIVKEKGNMVGFLIYDTHFFECSFISLVIISPSERRKGYASLLLNSFIKLSPTEKIFSSTNQSNTRMQKVFLANGFRPSGCIENLDEGDPEMIYFRLKNP